MKRFLSISILIIFAFRASDCYGQLKIVDNDNDKLWYIVRSSTWPPQPIPNQETTILKLGGAVMVNDTTYISLLSTRENSATTWDTIGFLREINHQVFYRPTIKVSEFIIYDFNLSLSSKFDLTLQYNRPPIPLHVVKIDSVFLGGVNRKRISFDYTDLVWIEGVGSTQGLLYDKLDFSGSRYEMSCCTEHGIIVYQNTNYSNCFCSTDIELVGDKNKTLYSNGGFIYFDKQEDSIFQLYDISGSLVLTFNIGVGGLNKDLRMLKKGVYLYRIINRNKIKVGKLISD